MPSFITTIHYTVLVALILSISEVMPSCSYYIKKGLVYIIIIAPSGRQSLFYAECIKVNMYLSYNVYSISNAKYMHYLILFNYLVVYLSCYRVLDLIHC